MTAKNYTADGYAISHSRVVASATGTQTSVAAAAADTAILASNDQRLGFCVENDSSTATLYLLCASGAASSTSKTVTIPPGGIYEPPAGLRYTGPVRGFWSAASGNARVTEYT